MREGHQVTLFASGDSRTTAELVPVCESSLRLNPRCMDPVAIHMCMVEEILKRQHHFDIIHAHIDYLGFALARRSRVPVVNTLHGRLDLWESSFLFREFDDCSIVSISDSQRVPAAHANWLATVYHGLPRSLYTHHENSGDYLVYIGRVSPEKKVESAIAIALATGFPLKIAAKVDKADEQYFKSEIRPLLGNSMIQFLGEVGDREKNDLVGSALAFLHPADWPEPFGLSLIEAMACGTPVIARRRGAIPEVVDHGITGYVFDTDDEGADYIRHALPGLSRKRCREHFEKRFPAERMTGDYLAVYGRLLEGRG